MASKHFCIISWRQKGKITNTIDMRLGDLIYYVTKGTGIKYLVDMYHKYRGTKCKCNSRRESLNNLTIKR
tara:strand:- start:997 stop:1206 length:210 start_codon:yes stop_codon:yes gene_type:complete